MNPLEREIIERKTNTFIPLSEGVTLCQETGEIRKGGDIKGRLSPGTSRVFFQLTHNPNVAFSYEEILTIYDDRRLDDRYPRDEVRRIQCAVGRIRERLNQVEKGLGDRLETIPAYGFRWNDPSKPSNPNNT